MRSLIIAFIACLLFSCTRQSPGKLFRKLSPAKTGIHFANNLAYNDSVSVLEFVYMFNGAGVALIDINNDNLQDIIFTGNMVPTKLYLNKGKLKFEDITAKAGVETSGWANGVAVVDINQDGFQDFYICRSGNYLTHSQDRRNFFYINNGNNTFTERAASMNLDEDGYDVQAAFLDYDKDGDLDMYLMRNATVKFNRSNTRPEQAIDKEANTDKLFRNNGNMTFTDVSQQAGIVVEGFGLGVSICDINNDNWPDVYVSNDFLTNDLMWVNNGDGTFTDKAKECLRHETYNGMGNDVADFNNDGLQDIMVVDMLPPDNKRWKLTMMGNAYDEFQQNLGYGYDPQYVRNTLQLNNGDGTFSDIGMLAGVHATEWSWAPLFADFNNDGWKDLFVSNGFREDINNLDFVHYGYNVYGKKKENKNSPEAIRKDRLEKLRNLPGIKVHNYLFRNNKSLEFEDVSDQWGMSDAGYSNGAVFGDLDNDGDLDLVVNKLDGPSAIYENKASQSDTANAWLRIKFNGAPGNLNGLDAKVWIWQDGMMQYAYFTPYRGYLSSLEQFVHFGIKNKQVDSVKVLWPDGKQQLITAVKSKQVITLDHRNARDVNDEKENRSGDTLFEPLANTGITFKHQEDYFVDFKLQPLLPHMHGRLGPGVAVADVNGDGREDFFVGGAEGMFGNLFLQQKDGRFITRQLPEVNTADNMGALFIDADRDGDADLYVAAGGTLAARKENAVYAHLFYVNDGKGGFTLSKNALPEIVVSSSGVKAADYDRDGDLDLFVGGRVSPGEYPVTPKSYLLRNDSRHGECRFTDVTNLNAKELGNSGMVTDALWTDFDNDGWVDLIVVGEFMPVKFFKNNSGLLSDVTPASGIVHSAGWWNSITGGDFDKDGDIDYVVGNLGLNGPYRASAQEPVCVYAADYDNNGRLDPIMCHYENGKEYIVHSRDDIVKQMTAMKGRFRNYHSYANATFKEAMREDEINKALVLKAERFENSFVENLGNGKFRLHALPLEAQLSPIFAMMTNDFDNDGNLDVLCVGNSYATEVQTGRYDAQGSLLLRGDGKGAFVADRTSLNLGGDNKSLANIIFSNGKQALIVGTNADSLKIIRVKKQLPLRKLLPGDAYALVTGKDGKTYRQEFYYGHSYLSQGSRCFTVSEGTGHIEIYDSKGAKRNE